jgi:hypothetical protein
MDNVFIERLWRSLKYECAYLHPFETGSEMRAGLTQWIGYYNAGRPHAPSPGRPPTRPIGQMRWTNRRPEKHQDRAYPDRQTVRRSGTTSPLAEHSPVVIDSGEAP